MKRLLAIIPFLFVGYLWGATGFYNPLTKKTSKMDVDNSGYFIKVTTIVWSDGRISTAPVSGAGSGSALWGAISGTITGQADLMALFSGIYTSTSALKSSIQQTSIATGTVQGNLDTHAAANVTSFQGVGVSTSGLKTDITNETNSRIAADTAIGVTTATLRTDLNTEITNRGSGDTAIGVTTATLRVDLNTEITNRQTGDTNIGIATGTLRSDLTTLDDQIAFDTTTIANAFNDLHTTDWDNAYSFVQSTPTWVAGDSSKLGGVAASLYALNRDTGSTSGVSKIIAGTNISISPTDGTGDVTINASGSVSAVDDLCRASTGYMQTQITAINGKLTTVAADTTTIKGLVDTETTNRTNADSALSTRLNTVATDTTTIKGLIDTETTNRTNADSAINTRLNTVAVDTTTLKGLIDGKQATGNYALNRDTKTVGVDVQAYDADLADLADGSLTGSKVGSGIVAANIANGSLGSGVIASSVAVNAVTIDQYKERVRLDNSLQILGSTTTAGTNAFRVSRWFDAPFTVSTMTVSVIGGTSVTGMIEQRAYNAQSSAGTDIWSGDITATTAYIGGTFSDTTIPGTAATPYALFFVPTSWSGAVNSVEFKGSATRD